jgi:(heptosyl)LPS beta-1,4-glucosyltransferase
MIASQHFPDNLSSMKNSQASLEIGESNKVPLSVVILTHNEEDFIERCITPMLWANEILVLDSGSTDRTQEIARSLGARVCEQKWMGGYCFQRHKAISMTKHNWVFILDADEIVTPELVASIQLVLNQPIDDRNAYSVYRPGDFHGILLPDLRIRNRTLTRLFNKKHANYEPTLNPHLQITVPGKVFALRGILIHWRAYGIDDYISSANRFATLEAQDFTDRGKHATFIAIIFWPIVRFIWSYIIRGEFLLGRHGLVHSMLEATREYIRYAKLWELQYAQPTLNPPAHIYSVPESHSKSTITTNDSK